MCFHTISFLGAADAYAIRSETTCNYRLPSASVQRHIAVWLKIASGFSEIVHALDFAVSGEQRLRRIVWPRTNVQAEAAHVAAGCGR
jgi:hypothetical protein